MFSFGTAKAEAPTYYAAINGEDMMAILKEMGFTPELSQDSHGDPLVRFQVEGLKSSIFFFDGADAKYKGIQFFCGFKDKVPLQKVNEWNQKRRFVRAYLDSNETINFECDVPVGGVGKEYLEEAVRRWRRLLMVIFSFFG